MRAFIAWGFQLGTQALQNHPERRRYHDSVVTRSRDAPWPPHIKPPPVKVTFLRGIGIVEELRKKGIPVDTGVVRKMIRQRLWQLFSPTISWRMINRRSQILNPYSLEECLRGVLDIWNGPALFPYKTPLDRSKDHSTKHDEFKNRMAQDTLSLGHVSSFELEADALVCEGKRLEEAVRLQSQIATKKAYHKTMHAILSELQSNPDLTLKQQVEYRRTIVLTLFGSNPRLGHRRRTEARRVNDESWDRVVTDWAVRGGKDRFRMRVGGLARTWKGELVIMRKKREVRVGMQRRRNRVIISGTGSKALNYFKEAWGGRGEGIDGAGDDGV